MKKQQATDCQEKANGSTSSSMQSLNIYSKSITGSYAGEAIILCVKIYKITAKDRH